MVGIQKEKKIKQNSECCHYIAFKFGGKKNVLMVYKKKSQMTL